MFFWIITAIVLMFIAVSGGSYAYATRPSEGIYAAPLGGLASLLMAGMVFLLILGAINGFDGSTFYLPGK